MNFSRHAGRDLVGCILQHASSGVMIRFSGWWVSGYAHVFILLAVVIFIFLTLTLSSVILGRSWETEPLVQLDLVAKDFVWSVGPNHNVNPL